MNRAIMRLPRLALATTPARVCIPHVRAFSSTVLKYNAASLPKEDPKSIHHQVTVDRELPDPFKDKYKNLKYAVVYGLGVFVSCVIIFNYEKTTSPILNSVFYVLRRNPDVANKLGEDIKYSSSYPWISGQLNAVKGQIDINFSVKGEKGTGQLYFKASRPDKATPFTIHHWYLVVDGETIDLKTFGELNM